MDVYSSDDVVVANVHQIGGHWVKGCVMQQQLHASSGTHTSWSQLIHQIFPYSAAVVCASNGVCIDGSTQRVVLKPGSTSIETNGCVPMPCHCSALIGKYCKALCTISDHHCLIGICLKDTGNYCEINVPL